MFWFTNNIIQFKFSDVVETFRQAAKTDYDLDLLAFPTLPSFSFNSMLKFTQVELDLMHDPEMYKIITLGIRGKYILQNLLLYDLNLTYY